jgi:serine phosphatase RsbU (regulator of sigma subunit)
MTPRQFRAILPNSFVMHKPKDIVSGDFYWISEQDNKIFVAAADCTGHGVPGAFMSLISFELFKKIIKIEKIYKPSEILATLNRNFEEVFGNIEDVTIKDGMDLSFCVLDKKLQRLEFSGAFNPVYIVRNDKLIELKGDNFSIGADLGEDYPPKVFTNHEFTLLPDDMIYLFSDGYADQFGGPEGKKYKYRRFRYLLLNIHKFDLERQMQILDENIEEWRGSSEQVDDILVIGIKI